MIAKSQEFVPLSIVVTFFLATDITTGVGIFARGICVIKEV